MCIGDHIRGIWNSRKYLSSSIWGLSVNNNPEFQFRSLEGSTILNLWTGKEKKIERFLTNPWRKIRRITFKIETNSTSQVLLSRNPFKKSCDRVESHLNDIGRGLDSSCPLVVALFKIITAPSPKNNSNILNQQKQKSTQY